MQDLKSSSAIFVLFVFIASCLAPAQDVDQARRPNPCLAAQGTIEPEHQKPMSLREMRDEIAKRVKLTEAQGAESYFLIAELMKRTGSYQAPHYYEEAIQADRAQPCYETFYGDYLRNFRGAMTPLFPQAEEHYFEGLKKARLRQGNTQQQADDNEAFVERGLSALYQRDGVALFDWRSNLVSGTQFLERPFSFFASIDKAAQTDADLDREADVRDYTSEVLFAQSSGRLHRPLTRDEARGLIRLKKPLETLDRIRFRYKSWPVLDVFYTHRQTDNDQVSDFFCVTPTSSPNCRQLESSPFNALRENDYGVAAQKPFTAFRYFDVSVSGTFKRTQRYGLIEFFPGSEEGINDYETRTAVSHFFGPDKATVDLGYTYQDIHPNLPSNVTPEPNRDRQFADATVTYQIFRPLPFVSSAYDRRFETRGWDFFSGTLADIESFGGIHVRRHDYFVGTSLKGIGRFDFTVQPTWFTSRVEGDPTQRNTQYRTNGNVLIRLVDEERNAGITEKSEGLHLAFLHLVIPFRDDVTKAGPNWFENHKVGVGFDSKFFTYARWTTFLGSVRYDRLRFYQINKNVNAFSVNLSMGF